MSDGAAIATLAITCVILAAYAVAVTADWRKAARRLMELQFANPHARLLGRTVEARVYEASAWERMVVVAVSWHGAVCVRPERDMEAPGRWIDASRAPDRVREVRRG